MCNFVLPTTRGPGRGQEYCFVRTKDASNPITSELMHLWCDLGTTLVPFCSLQYLSQKRVNLI